MITATLLTIAALTGAATMKAKVKGIKPLSPQLSAMFVELLDAKLPPEKYTQAAALFAKEGFSAQAELLAKRAKLASLPASEKRKLKTAHKAALKSEKPDAIRDVASILDRMGAVGSAKTLRDHATRVEAANGIAEHVVTLSPPQEEDDGGGSTADDPESPEHAAPNPEASLAPIPLPIPAPPLAVTPVVDAAHPDVHAPPSPDTHPPTP